MTMRFYFPLYHRAAIKRALCDYCSPSMAAATLRRFEAHAAQYRASVRGGSPVIDDVLRLNSLYRASLHILEHLPKSNGGRHGEMMLQRSRGVAELEHRMGVEYTYGDFPWEAETGKERLCLYIRLAEMTLCESVHAGETLEAKIWTSRKSADRAFRRLVRRISSDWSDATAHPLPYSEGEPGYLEAWDQNWNLSPNPLWMTLDGLGIPVCADVVDKLVRFTLDGRKPDYDLPQ